MKYSNQPIQNSASRVAIDFQGPTPAATSPIDLNTNWNSSKTTADWLGTTLNRPLAKSNRALREFAKRALA